MNSGHSEPYELAVAPPARRAITIKLPPDVATAAVDYITGPLIEAPHRVGKPLHEPWAHVLAPAPTTNAQVTDLGIWLWRYLGATRTGRIL